MISRTHQQNLLIDMEVEDPEMKKKNVLTWVLIIGIGIAMLALMWGLS